MRLIVKLKCRDCQAHGEGELEFTVAEFITGSVLPTAKTGLMFKSLYLPAGWWGSWPPDLIRCASCVEKAGLPQARDLK